MAWLTWAHMGIYICTYGTAGTHGIAGTHGTVGTYTYSTHGTAGTHVPGYMMFHCIPNLCQVSYLDHYLEHKQSHCQHKMDCCTIRTPRIV